MSRRTAASVVLSLLAVAGCAGTPAAAPLTVTRPNWWQRRGDELARAFECTLLVGPGLGARVTATRYLQVGALAIGPADRESLVAPLPERRVGLRDGELRGETLRTVEYGLSPWYQCDALLFDSGVTDGEAGSWRGDLAATRGAQFSAQLHLGLLGASAGFDPLAFGEFLLGLVGIEDDRGS